MLKKVRGGWVPPVKHPTDGNCCSSGPYISFQGCLCVSVTQRTFEQENPLQFSPAPLPPLKDFEISKPFRMLRTSCAGRLWCVSERSNLHLQEMLFNVTAENPCKGLNPMDTVNSLKRSG